MGFALKVLLSSIVIASTSWLAGKKPALAGFLLSLPIASMLAIAFAQVEWRDPEKAALFAKSILLGVPLSLTFFLPFLFLKRFHLTFWGAYATGFLLLCGSFALHRAVLGR